MRCAHYALTLLGIAALGTSALCQAVEQQETAKVKENDEKDKEVRLVDTTLASGGVQLKVPETWKQKQPRSRIIEREFAIPAVKGDKVAGRLTMMRSGGSVTQNIQRWFGQFTQPDKKATKDVAKVEKKQVHGQDVVIVDISGTFQDRPGGPFAGGRTVERKNYRMLGGIVQTKGQGQYFFKLYGPEKTIASAAKPFKKMMESITSE